LKVLIAASGGSIIPYLCGASSGNVGMMFSLDTPIYKTYNFMPYAIDNGKYQAVIKNKPWDEIAFFEMIEKIKDHGTRPEFVVVPDVPFDAEETKQEFKKYAPRLEKLGWPLAFAAQDGMTPADVPAGYVAFLGGSREFKTKFMQQPLRLRVHVGRVNRFKHLKEFDLAGAESVDGSGYLRGGWGNEPLNQLHMWTRWVEHGRTPEAVLF